MNRFPRHYRKFLIRAAVLIGTLSAAELALAQAVTAQPSDVAIERPSSWPAQSMVSDRAERRSLEMIAPQAKAHNEYAMKLAECGAVQSAQAEFITALSMIADALDADTNNATRAHARAVQAGLTAIKETQDFVPDDSPHDVEINLSQLTSIHKTPVLRNVDTSRISRAIALQQYHSYATQQLAFAGGQSAIASMSLYGLGRAESVTIAGSGRRNRLSAPNAMALYQAALLVDPHNFMASNELGVLMARYGDLEGAAAHLLRSVSLKPQVETWHNLAAVYRSMGQLEKSQQAEREREKMLTEARSRGAAAENPSEMASNPTLQWVDVDTFSATGTAHGFDGPAASTNQPASIPPRESIGKRMVAKLNPFQKSSAAPQAANGTRLNPVSDSTRGSETDRQPWFK